MPRVTDGTFVHKKIKEAAELCLTNKLGITDRNKLDKVEHMFSYLRMLELNEKQLEKQDTLIAGLQEVNKYLLQDVYDWAGELRKGNHNGYVIGETDIDYHYDKHYFNYNVLSINYKVHEGESLGINDINDILFDSNDDIYDPIYEELTGDGGFKIDESDIYNENLLKEFEQDNHLEGLDINQFSEKASYYLYNLRHAHHFYKGTQRLPAGSW